MVSKRGSPDVAKRNPGPALRLFPDIASLIQATLAASPLPDQRAAGSAQQIPQRAIEPRRHSARGRFGFAQRGDLQEQLIGCDIGVIVGQQIERHRGNFFQ